LNEHLILIGFPGSGKTTVGKAASQLLSRPFIDTDRKIEFAFHKETGLLLDCHSIVRTYGTPFFRSLEKETIAALTKAPAAVIALGGGAVEVSLKTMGRLIYLAAPFSVLAERNLVRLPLPTYVDPDDPMGSLKKLYDTRINLYEQLAHATIDTTNLSIPEIVEKVCKHGQ